MEAVAPGLIDVAVLMRAVVDGVVRNVFVLCASQVLSLMKKLGNQQCVWKVRRQRTLGGVVMDLSGPAFRTSLGVTVSVIIL